MSNSNSEDSRTSELSRRKFLRTGSAVLATTALLGVNANALDKQAVKNDDHANFSPAVSPKVFPGPAEKPTRKFGLTYQGS